MENILATFIYIALLVFIVLNQKIGTKTGVIVGIGLVFSACWSNLMCLLDRDLSFVEYMILPSIFSLIVFVADIHAESRREEEDREAAVKQFVEAYMAAQAKKGDAK